MSCHNTTINASSNEIFIDIIATTNAKMRNQIHKMMTRAFEVFDSFLLTRCDVSSICANMYRITFQKHDSKAKT